MLSHHDVSCWVYPVHILFLFLYIWLQYPRLEIQRKLSWIEIPWPAVGCLHVPPFFPSLKVTPLESWLTIGFWLDWNSANFYSQNPFRFWGDPILNQPWPRLTHWLKNYCTRYRWKSALELPHTHHLCHGTITGSGSVLSWPKPSRPSELQPQTKTLPPAVLPILPSWCFLNEPEKQQRTTSNPVIRCILAYKHIIW